MGLRNKKRESNKLGPFRGQPPRKVFQMLDIGSGRGDFLARRAAANPRRIYAAVDPIYDVRRTEARAAHDELAKSNAAFGTIFRVLLGKHRNIRIIGKDFSEFIGEMKRKGWKTRSINIDMPSPLHTRRQMDYEKIFSQVQDILLPNGKIFVASEDKKTIEHIKNAAEKCGLKAREMPPLTGKERKRLTMQMRFQGTDIYRLEITFGLKKALPEREQRKNWPRR
ncbi:MAG TPA: hypothetical protein VI977_00125 [archaeon]|nr:hypothetical protein [archaeon]